MLFRSMASSNSEIFVLARTHRIISELSNRMKLIGIRHIVRTEEHHSGIEAAKDEVTLATVHSIKGLEADAVFVVGCNGLSFPCKTSEHPVMELTKIYDYDKEEEERRLFYVAMSRAKNRLYLTYSGKNPTRFINEKMIGMISSKRAQPKLINNGEPVNVQPGGTDKLSLLKLWRRELAQKLNLPAYIIMHDRTLMDIVEMNPVDVEDLRNVRGIGPAKIERYGNQIIDIINKK